MDAGRAEELSPEERHPAGAGRRGAARRRSDPLAERDVATRIVEIDSRLQRDDPALARKFRRLDGIDRRRDVLVFTLLAASALLLAVAVTHRAWPAGGAGVAAYLGSFAVDRRRRRGAGTTERSGPWR